MRACAAPVVEHCIKRYPELLDAATRPMLAVLKGSSSGAGSEAEQAAMGAVKFLQNRAVSRRAMHDTAWLADVCGALLSSAGHEGPAAQAALYDLFLVTALRFSRSSADRFGRGADGAR